MRRWNAYIGELLVLDERLYRAKHGLIDESGRCPPARL